MIVSIYPMDSNLEAYQVFNLVPIASDFSFDSADSISFTDVSRVDSKLTGKASVGKGFYILALPTSGFSANVIYFSW